MASGETATPDGNETTRKQIAMYNEIMTSTATGKPYLQAKTTKSGRDDDRKSGGVRHPH
jgi:hypothetical protein